MLLAPLAEEAGGYGVCREILEDGSIGQKVVVFSDTRDPHYRAILDMVVAGKSRLDQVKRFDMPGFRPTDAYIREMQIYGVLSDGIDPDNTPLDPYKLDRLYWKKFEYSPHHLAATSIK